MKRVNIRLITNLMYVRKINPLMPGKKTSWNQIVKDEIYRISEISDLKKMKGELLKLKNWISLPGIHRSPSGKYYYFYFVDIIYEDDRSKKIPRSPAIGRILKTDYKINKEKIEELREKKDVEGLKTFLSAVKS